MTKEIKIIFAYFIILAAVLFGATKVLSDCTGCGDDGHQVCPIEKKHTHKTFMKEEHKTSESTPEDGVVALLLHLNGKMIEWVYKENIGQCLKSKRVASREVGGERVVFSCKLVKGLLQEDKQAKYGIRLLKVLD